MQRGPKAGVDPSPLPFKSSLKGAARFAAFCRRYIVTPKGHGVGKPMILRPWQVKLVGAILDPPQRPRTAGIMMPRGQGKTSLMAALCVYTLFTGPEGTSVVVAAVDQRQAELTFKTAARMVELNPELLARCQVFRERLEIPAKGGTFVALPAEAKRLRDSTTPWRSWTKSESSPATPTRRYFWHKASAQSQRLSASEHQAPVAIPSCWTCASTG